MRAFNHTCLGYSHQADDKPCQDYSVCFSDENTTMAVVCDGHGGAHYFRSDVGAQFAANITIEKIKSFLTDCDVAIFKSKPFTQVEANLSDKNLRKQTAIDKAFRQLFSSIIYQWGVAIEEHSKKTAISEWEQTHVDSKYLDEFNNGTNLEKIYGCTLMAFVCTRDFWFAFHLGDGKCISFAKDSWSEPIPWDDRCFLNKTTSICDATAIDEFRYCYSGDGTFPDAVFLGSDGIDDSFGETPNMVNFYIQLLKSVNKDGEQKAMESLIETLPELSRIGSKDDMSVACVYDENTLAETVISLTKYQLQTTEEQLEESQRKQNDLLEEQKRIKHELEVIDQNNKKLQIELQYNELDIKRNQDSLDSLIKKKDILSKELGDNSVDTKDAKENETM